MKSCIFFLTAMLLIAITHTKSIAQNEKFIGTWRIDMDRTLSIMDGNVKARYDTLSAEAHARAVNAMKDRVFAFSEDGSVAVNWTSRSGPRVSVGAWVVGDSKGDLLITIGERTTGFSYRFQSDTTLILSGKKKRGFFDNLYLRKMN